MSTGCESACSCKFLYIYIYTAPGFPQLCWVRTVLCSSPHEDVKSGLYLPQSNTQEKGILSQSGSDSNSSSILVVVQGEN